MQYLRGQAKWRRMRSSTRLPTKATKIFLFFLFVSLFVLLVWSVSRPSSNQEKNRASSIEVAKTLKEPMGPSIVEVSSVEEFDGIKPQLAGKPDVFLFFLASVDPNTGKSWCPDTRAGDPIVMNIFQTLTRPVTVVRISVGDRPTWKTSSNPFRKPPFSIYSVPSLTRWENGKLGDVVLGDYECQQEEEVRKLIDATSNSAA